ncbi:MAG: CotH kinase family protein [candidate division Zixibacteria bacterium]|nr:CotH kinase family protein [candidate division Zixibacteria bacterium]
MKKQFYILISILVLVSGVFGQDFYDVNRINTIEIIFAEENWDRLLDSLFAAGEEERLTGTAVINGVTFDSVGVRYKGHSTYSPFWIKNPLNIKLDYIIDDRNIEGYETLKLANSLHDPSFVREVLGYEIARKYMPAGRANYMKVFINDLYLGLYVSVQDIDKFFARTHDYDDEGARFKAILGDETAFDTAVIWGYLGDDATSYADLYEMKSDEGWPELTNFLWVVNNVPAAVDSVLNVDRHLWMLAFDNLLANLDAPINIHHNFYLFRDFSDRFNPIIWDLNQSFGGFRFMVSTGQVLSFTNLMRLDPFVNLNHPDYPVIGKILSDPTRRRMYLAHMKTIMEENFTNGWYETRGLELQDIIAAEVMADPNKFYSDRDFRDNLYDGIITEKEMIVGLVQLMSARLDYLKTLAEFKSAPPAVSFFSYEPDVVLPNTSVALTAEVDGAGTVILGYCRGDGKRFDRVVMHDDGAHDDGAAGDGVYGATIPAGNDDIRYYIYAENDKAGVFSPPRAEYEYYIIEVVAPVTFDIKINEFMASNKTTAADQDGEFDDWIELYNPSDSAVSLAGYYLSDDGAEVTQWVFPDTFIAPGSFLLVWADDDEDQAGLHTNFKLSASGEAVVLSDPALVLVDEIAFGPQNDDVSYGRYPDGGEEWRFYATPTPDGANASVSCCEGMVGNVDCSASEAPDISDVLALIDHLYINHAPLCCPAEAETDPAFPGLDISDISRLIHYIYLSGDPLPACPD